MFIKSILGLKSKLLDLCPALMFGFGMFIDALHVWIRYSTITILPTWIAVDRAHQQSGIAVSIGSLASEKIFIIKYIFVILINFLFNYLPAADRSALTENLLREYFNASINDFLIRYIWLSNSENRTNFMLVWLATVITWYSKPRPSVFPFKTNFNA